MSILYRWTSFIWAFFVLFGSGLAGGPDISIPLPWMEITGFFLLAFLNFERVNKIFGYLIIIFILINLIHAIFFELQLPHFKWADMQVRYWISIGLLLFCAFSIWKLRPEKNNDLDEGIEIKKE